MNTKNLNLFLGIAAALVFLGYLGETEPHTLFGISINIWIVRVVWLIVAVVNVSNYLKLKKGEK
ncbi:hypothetical protein [Tenacibaculum sp. 190524A05c]|uniref:hypothetical protein n=1 Tax=Tenacibaculum platacis TaxID=3137852 RepID=UPI0032B1CDF6